jgi:hypothetical protein
MTGGSSSRIHHDRLAGDGTADGDVIVLSDQSSRVRWPR